jgi:hypothetical protein
MPVLAGYDDISQRLQVVPTGQEGARLPCDALSVCGGRRHPGQQASDQIQVNGFHGKPPAVALYFNTIARLPTVATVDEAEGVGLYGTVVGEAAGDGTS